MRTLVLASTSRYRRAVLDQLGVEYQAVAPDYEEDHSLPLSPADMVMRFACGKAESVAARFPDALIVGSDQLAELDGAILTKPGSEDAAVQQLLKLASRTHLLHTAVAVHAEGTTVRELVTHRMTMRPVSPELARAYVQRDQPIDCAGAYKIEALGLSLFEAMEGTDHSAIVGLPVTALSSLLAQHGDDLLQRCLG